MASAHDRTVGILYCGDLGTALARLLKKSGLHVVTTCEGRGPRTVERARAADIEILPTLDDVVRTADVLVSAVLPEAVERVVADVVARSKRARNNCLFVDVNSIDLQVVPQLERQLTAAGLRFVDAAVHGGAANLAQQGVLYVSGPNAPEVESLFHGHMRVRDLGPEIGSASRIKLLMGGLSKCLNALFVETAILARQSQMLDAFLHESRQFYPGIMTAVERMLPTYPEHARRRVTELQGIENLARSEGAPHAMIGAARELLQTSADAWHTAWLRDGLLPISEIIAIAAAAASQPSADTGDAP